MWIVFPIILLLTVRSGCFVGALFLAAAFDILLRGNGISLDPAGSLIYGAFLLAVPIAGYLCGYFIDLYSFSGTGADTFRRLAVPLTFTAALSSVSYLDFFESAVVVAQNSTGLGLNTALFTSIVSGVVLFSGLSAVLLILAGLIVEIPFYWLCRGGGTMRRVSLAAFRPLLVIILLSLSFNLITGLCWRSLRPTTILAFIGS